QVGEVECTAHPGALERQACTGAEVHHDVVAGAEVGDAGDQRQQIVQIDAVRTRVRDAGEGQDVVRLVEVGQRVGTRQAEVEQERVGAAAAGQQVGAGVAAEQVVAV